MEQLFVDLLPGVAPLVAGVAGESLGIAHRVKAKQSLRGGTEGRIGWADDRQGCRYVQLSGRGGRRHNRPQ